ncbi:site-specific integrase [Acidithiobacillus ferriphilus]|uniref:site-specific integrase n=1 Tax=Acidithiobacillus ferriphilus TaxID=1689834 RepID=UPI002DBE7413|nr:site-specific integrase [Acidithiobacillus ferriphilus]MEB8536430.1 site-specific integrase [Acidithiobacillus ferriphilus]
MATIRSREDQDGITIGWQAQIKRKGFPLQVKTFRTKAEATQWATVTESEMMRGVWRDRSRAEVMTVTALLERYRKEILPEKKSRQGPESVIRILSASELGKLSLAALTPEALAIYRDRRLKSISKKTGRPTSSQTVRHEISLLSRAIAHAIKEWGIPIAHGNPCLQIKMPAQAKPRDRRLVDDEEERLLAACAESRNVWLRPVVVFAIETGMRAGEMLEKWELNQESGNQEKKSFGLQWADVDLKRRTAHLTKTKNGEARTVPLSSSAVAVLEALPRNLDGRVFGTTYEGIHQSFVRACKRADILDLRFHDLRHEATSRLFEKSLNPMQVAAITGHKTLQMLKRYTHLRAEDLAKILG